MRDTIISYVEKKEDRSGYEDKYLFGRFTELLLVYFWKNRFVVEIV